MVDEGRVEADRRQPAIKRRPQDLGGVGIAQSLRGEVQRDVGRLDLDPWPELDARRLGPGRQLERVGSPTPADDS